MVDFVTPSVIQVIKGFSNFFMHGGCFCHFLAFRIHFDVLAIFWSFFMFWGFLGHLLGFKCVLDIFFVFLRAFWSFIRLIGVFCSYSSHQGYFG